MHNYDFVINLELFFFLGWQNVTLKQIKQEVYQLSKISKYLILNYASTTHPLSISQKSFDTKSTYS
jgi:hypothetical protein